MLRVEELEPRCLLDVNPLNLRDPQSAMNAAIVLMQQKNALNSEYNAYVNSIATQAWLAVANPTYLSDLTARINACKADLDTIDQYNGGVYHPIVVMADQIVNPPPPPGGLP